MRFSSLLALSALSLVACGGSEPEAKTPTPPAPSVSATPTPSASASVTPPAPVDPVKAAAQKVLSCKWSDGEPDWDCAERKAWDDLEATRNGAADATLVAMLGESDGKLVYLAAKALDHAGDKYRTDKGMADKILGKLEGTLEPATQETLANVAGAIDVKETGFGDRMLAISKKLPVPARVRFIGAAQFRNSDFFYESTAAMAKSEPDPKLREAAVRSFWVGTPMDKGQEVCELWTSVAEDDKAGDSLQALAADYAAWTPMDPCAKHFDRLLARTDKRLKAGPLEGWDWANVLEHLSVNKAATAAQKKKAIAGLKGIAENTKNKNSARRTAARALIAADRPLAKAVIAKFAKDKDEHLVKSVPELEKDLAAAEAAAKEKAAKEKEEAGKDAGKKDGAKKDAGKKDGGKKK